MPRIIIVCLIMICVTVTELRAGERHDSLSRSLPEVSVTAIKQAPSLALQPVASTTIDAAEVERERIITMKQASEIVPNFYVPDYGSRMTSTIYVRGLLTLRMRALYGFLRGHCIH